MRFEPNALPTAEELNGATEDDVIEVINWWATQQKSPAPPEFWTNELSRRRTDRLMGRLGELLEKGADQNAEMVSMTRSIRRWTVGAGVVAAAVLTLTLVGVTSRSPADRRLSQADAAASSVHSVVARFLPTAGRAARLNPIWKELFTAVNSIDKGTNFVNDPASSTFVGKAQGDLVAAGLSLDDECLKTSA